MAELMTAEGNKPTGFCDTTLAGHSRQTLELLCKALKLTITPTGARGIVKEDLIAAIYVFNMDVQKTLGEAGLREVRMVLSYALQKTNREFTHMLKNDFNINTNVRFKGPLSMVYLDMVIKAKEVKKPAGFDWFIRGHSGDADFLFGTASPSAKEQGKKATEAQLALITKGIGSAHLSEETGPAHDTQALSVKEETDKAAASQPSGKHSTTIPLAAGVDDIYNADDLSSGSAPPVPDQTKGRSEFDGETSTNHKVVTRAQGTVPNKIGTGVQNVTMDEGMAKEKPCAANSFKRPVFTIPDLYSDDEEEDEDEQEEVVEEKPSDGRLEGMDIIELLKRVLK